MQCSFSELLGTDATQWDRFLCLGKQIRWRHCKTVSSKYGPRESCCSAAQTETTSCFVGNGFVPISRAFQDALYRFPVPRAHLLASFSRLRVSTSSPSSSSLSHTEFGRQNKRQSTPAPVVYSLTDIFRWGTVQTESSCALIK